MTPLSRYPHESRTPSESSWSRHTSRPMRCTHTWVSKLSSAAAVMRGSIGPHTRPTSPQMVMPVKTLLAPRELLRSTSLSSRSRTPHGGGNSTAGGSRAERGTTAETCGAEGKPWWCPAFVHRERCLPEAAAPWHDLCQRNLGHALWLQSDPAGGARRAIAAPSRAARTPQSGTPASRKGGGRQPKGASRAEKGYCIDQIKCAPLRMRPAARANFLV